jgi:hypothetical protein
MKPFLWTDSHGRAWHVYDFRTIQGKRRGVPIGDWRAESRAYVAANGEQVLVANFGPVASHEPEARFLEDYLRWAKPIGAKAGERMDDARPMQRPGND